MTENLDVNRSEDIVRLGGGTVLYHYYNNSVVDALMAIFPQHKWEVTKYRYFSRTVPSKSQVIRNSLHNRKFRLFRFLQTLLTDVTDLHMNYILQDLKFSSSGTVAGESNFKFLWNWIFSFLH